MLREAYTLADAADYLAELRGEKPDDEMAIAMPLIDRVLALDPRSARAEHARAIFHTALARVKCDHREDCEADVDAALASLRRVIELDPGYTDAYSDITFLLQERGERVREAGQDPRKIFDDAIATAERGIQNSPRAERLQGDLAAVWQARADYEAEHSLDPSVSLGKSIAAFEAALAINPNDAAALNNLGLAIHTRAFYRLAHGQPEGEAGLGRAAQASRRVIAIGGARGTARRELAVRAERARRARPREGRGARRGSPRPRAVPRPRARSAR